MVWYMVHGTWYRANSGQAAQANVLAPSSAVPGVGCDYGTTSKIIHRSSHVTAHMKWLSNVCGEIASMIVFASGMVRKQKTAWRDVISGMPIATATAVQKKTTADPSSERVYRLLEHRARTLASTQGTHPNSSDRLGESVPEPYGQEWNPDEETLIVRLHPLNHRYLDHSLANHLKAEPGQSVWPVFGTFDAGEGDA
eukprot:scaffold69950_cov64-Phaeocystis_antarctica.AAC.1